jgi:hypothetical protein
MEQVESVSQKIFLGGTQRMRLFSQSLERVAKWLSRFPDVATNCFISDDRECGVKVYLGSGTDHPAFSFFAGRDAEIDRGQMEDQYTIVDADSGIKFCWSVYHPVPAARPTTEVVRL